MSGLDLGFESPVETSTEPSAEPAVFPQRSAEPTEPSAQESAPADQSAETPAPTEPLGDAVESAERAEVPSRPPSFQTLELSEELQAVEEANRRHTKKLEDLVRTGGRFFTDAQRAVIQRRNQTVKHIFKQLEESSAEVNKMRSGHKLEAGTPEYEAAMKDETSIVVNFQDNKTHTTYMSAIKFGQEKYNVLKEFCNNITDDCLEAHGKATGRQDLLKLKGMPGAEKEYITAVLYAFAKQSATFKDWVFSEADASHRCYLPDGTFDRSMLPSDQWTVIELKGGGEVPILKDDLPLTPILADNWFFKKVKGASALDRRFMAKEFDMQGDTSRVGWVIKYVQHALEKYWNMVMPSDKDKAYYFDLESETPYDGVKGTVKTSAGHSDYYVSRDLAQMLFVPDGKAPRRYKQHVECIDMALNIKTLRTFAATGGEEKEPEAEDEN